MVLKLPTLTYYYYQRTLLVAPLNRARLYSTTTTTTTTTITSMPGTRETKKLFLSAPKYAVVGASKDQSKFGTKVS